jgi:hypothetical protein
MAGRMRTHEAAALRRQHATEGSISPADQGRALAELERLLVERAEIRWRLEQLAVGPWAVLRVRVEELARAVGGETVTPPDP